jgi:hypothetical protein
MKKHFIIFIFFFSLCLYGASLSPTVVQAIEPLLSDGLIKEAECSGGNCSLNTFIVLGVNLSNMILGIVGSLTLAMFVYGGVMLVISGGSSERISKGKEIILGSVVGLFIVFGSYMIISFVSTDLLGVPFDGTAPEDNIQAEAIGGKCENESKGVCVSDKFKCVDSWGQEGSKIGASDCGAGKNCCVYQSAPTVTCRSTGRECSSPICRAGYIEASPQLPCENGGRCCELPNVSE